MKVFSQIITVLLIAGCSSYVDIPKPDFDNPYDEINAYFERMGLTPKGEQSRILKGTKKEIMIGLQQIYNMGVLP